MPRGPLEEESVQRGPLEGMLCYEGLSKRNLCFEERVRGCGQSPRTYDGPGRGKGETRGAPFPMVSPREAPPPGLTINPGDEDPRKRPGGGGKAPDKGLENGYRLQLAGPGA